MSATLVDLVVVVSTAAAPDVTSVPVVGALQADLVAEVTPAVVTTAAASESSVTAVVVVGTVAGSWKKTRARHRMPLELLHLVF